MKLRLNPVFITLFVLLLTLQCIHLKQATQHYQDGNYLQSIQLCKSAIETDSTDSKAYLLLSKSYLVLDSLPQALQAAQLAHQWMPDNIQNQKQLTDLYLIFGNQAAEQKNYRMAFENFQQANKLSPKDTLAVEAMANYLYKRGQLDRAKTKYELLLTLRTDQTTASKKINAIHERTQTANAATEKGIAAIQRKHYKTAQTELKKALKAKPDHKEAKYQLHMAKGHSFYKKGSKSKSAYWEAIESYGLAMAIKDSIAEPHYWLARAYEKKDDREFTNAIDEYEWVVKIDPDGPFAKESKKRAKKLKALKKKLDKFWGRK